MNWLFDLVRVDGGPCGDRDRDGRSLPGKGLSRFAEAATMIGKKSPLDCKKSQKIPLQNV
ncbi:MAG: hypothetical protein AB4352_28875 [Hormoscilla sp.]